MGKKIDFAMDILQPIALVIGLVGYAMNVRKLFELVKFGMGEGSVTPDVYLSHFLEFVIRLVGLHPYLGAIFGWF